MINWFFSLKKGQLSGDISNGTFCTYFTGITIEELRVDGDKIIAKTSKGVLELDMHSMDTYYKTRHLTIQNQWIQSYSV